MKDWKSTLAGIFTGLMGMCGLATTFALTMQSQKVFPDYTVAIWLAVITFISGSCRIWIGVIQKDPSEKSTTNNTQKLGALALICLVLMVPLSACSGVTVAQDIVNWTPTLQGVVSTTCTVMDSLQPTEQILIGVSCAAFKAGSDLVVTQAKAYLANPNATILAQLQTQVLTFQSTVNASLLNAARIINPQNQQRVLTGIQGIATIVSAILALVIQVSPKATQQKLIQSQSVALLQIAPIMDTVSARQVSIDLVSDHYQISRIEAFDLVVTNERNLIAAQSY